MLLAQLVGEPVELLTGGCEVDSKMVTLKEAVVQLNLLHMAIVPFARGAYEPNERPSCDKVSVSIDAGYSRVRSSLMSCEGLFGTAEIHFSNLVSFAELATAT